MGAQAMRRHNVALVMELIARDAPVSRVELAQRTGLTKATVSSLVAELTGAELVRDLGPEPGRAPGRPAGRLVLDPYGPVALGLQFASGHIAGVILDLSGRPLARQLRRFDVAGADAADGVRASRPVLRRLFDEATTAGRLVAGVGVAVGGLVSGGLVSALPLGWRGVDVRALVAGELRALDLHGLDVVVAGEVACAALAEYQAGAARDWLYLGGEEVIGLAPLNPAAELAGDLGHVPVRRRGEPCPCGGRGCLELYAGRAGMASAAGVAEAAGVEEPLVARVRAGDPGALRALDRAAEALADALVGVRALLAPETIVLGGRLAAFGEPFRRRVVERLAPGLTLRPAKLGADAALRGAAGSVIARVVADPLAWIEG
ncbi:ROK family transcriptional regulator [Amycolatopsis thermalba]|uniref:ROK family transcriptional regulator n=1 Tax=Amycolatopsis thermalba TaxID=944492 RepID=A0ABY4P6E6_9PSEU|nr:ROK family transcriptional regulator [Amycolatopsis thermalba]UQS27889.1 ROK family transcriptional regulator [Amycolatopsis thermalba]